MFIAKEMIARHVRVTNGDIVWAGGHPMLVEACLLIQGNLHAFVTPLLLEQQVTSAASLRRRGRKELLRFDDDYELAVAWSFEGDRVLVVFADDAAKIWQERILTGKISPTSWIAVSMTDATARLEFEELEELARVPHPPREFPRDLPPG